MTEKPVISAREAAGLVKEGDAVMIGGFLNCGTPMGLVQALVEQGTRHLVLIANDTAICNPAQGTCSGIARLVRGRQFRKIIATHIGTNLETQRQMTAGETEVLLVPQGTMAERIRAAGFGLGGILTPTGVGTEVEEGKQVVEVKGRKYLLEEPLAADVALILAKKADRAGNLVYSKASRNFNPLMATAAKRVIAEVQEIVDVGEIDPEDVVTPFIFVDYLVVSQR
jgi:acetate CoA/acetoacetate CoA-transferase alpha subunit